MKTMFIAALAVFLATGTSSAAVILDTTVTLDPGDPTQIARLFRDAIPSDWTFSKAFPGISGTGARSYEVVTFNTGLTPYLQFSIDDPSVYVFAAVYSPVYTPSPSPTAVGYLGDAGSSGNSFGNPLTFQIVSGLNTTLSLVIMQVNAGVGFGSPIGVLIEGFVDTEYNNPASVPEPATFALAGSALAGALLWRQRKSRQS